MHPEIIAASATGGGGLLATGSVIAAFLAGGVALFAPCCIVFMAPSFLAGAAKNRRWRLLPLTFIFAAGLAVIMLPLTLGASMLSGAISRFHEPLYYIGGALMIFLAVFSFLGKMWSLPSFIHAPDTRHGDGASFFALGVFSGIASSCCAPVLVGVMTLSALSSNRAGGAILGLAFVFGMVFPLFIMALVWDKARLNEKSWLRAKPHRFTIFGKTIVTNTVNIVVAIGFFVMGVFIIILANQKNMDSGFGFQRWISSHITRLFTDFGNWISPVPEWLQAIILFAVVAVIIWATLTGRRRKDGTRYPKEDADSDGVDPDGADSDGVDPDGVDPADASSEQTPAHPTDAHHCH